MKKLVFILLILTQTGLTYSQINTTNFSCDIRYPVPLGNNFINKGAGDGYSGVIDAEFDYNIVKVGNWGIGILLNTSIFRLDKYDLTLLVMSPKMKVDYTITLGKISLIPQTGFGYSGWRFRKPAYTFYDGSGNPIEIKEYKQNDAGLTFKGATKLVINSSKRINWYCQISYEFTKLEKPTGGPADSKYNRNIQILYPGIGMIWKFNKE